MKRPLLVAGAILSAIIVVWSIALFYINNDYKEIETLGSCIYTEKVDFIVKNKTTRVSRYDSKIYYIYLNSLENNDNNTYIKDVTEDYYNEVSSGDIIEVNTAIYKLKNKYARFLYTKDNDLFEYFITNDTLINKEAILEECILFDKQINIHNKIGYLILDILIISVFVLLLILIKETYTYSNSSP